MHTEAGQRVQAVGGGDPRTDDFQSTSRTA